jgi:hypothetical protein
VARCAGGRKVHQGKGETPRFLLPACILAALLAWAGWAAPRSARAAAGTPPASVPRSGAPIGSDSGAPVSPVRATSGHVILEPSPETGQVGVTEVWVVTNDTGTEQPASASGVQFALPEVAADLQTDTRLQDATVVGHSLVDARPLPPGETRYMLGYTVPYTGTTLSLSRVLDLPTDAIQVVALVEGAHVAGASLGLPQALTMNGQPMVAAAGQDLPAGLDLALRVTGLPPSNPQPGAATAAALPLGPSPVGMPLLAAWGLVLALAGMLTALVYPLRAQGMAPGAGGSAAYREVIQRIARLDDAASRTGVPSRPRDRRRAELLARAAALAPTERKVR